MFKTFIRKIPLFLANTVVFLTILCLFGWLVRETAKGKQWVPHNVSRSVSFFTTLPDQLIVAKAAVEKLPLVFVPTPENFESINELEEDVKVLTSYANSNWKRTIAIINLRDGHVYKEWIVDSVWNVHNRICHPLMLADSSIIYGLEWYSGLNRLSKDGEVLWRQKNFFNHHGKNMDTDSTLWTCSYIKAPGTGMPHRGTFVVGGKKYSILDNNITRINAYTGEILFDKSVLEIMFEHGLEHLLIKSDLAKDPIHLNDVQPALADGPYFDKGDLFLSARSGSWIMQYRPSTDSIIRMIEGPFYAQHDVDIESDSTIILFNNNTHRREIFTPGVGEISKVKVLEIPPFQSEIVRYYLGSERFERVENEIMSQNKIYTMTEGVVDVLPEGGYFVEEQNSSILWVIKDGKVQYKGVLPSQHEGHHHLANWGRVMQ